MSAKRITIGRTFSQTPVETEDSSNPVQTFVLYTGKRADFRFERVAAKEIEEKTFVDTDTNGRDQAGLTPESLKDIIRTIRLQQFVPAIGIRRGEQVEILDGSRRRAAALHCKTGLNILVTDADISAEEARKLAQDIQTAREHSLREIGMRLLALKAGGLSQKEIAQSQGLSPAKVTRALQAASVPGELLDYKALLIACEQLQESGQTLDTLIDGLAGKVDDVRASENLADDEIKNAILRYVRAESAALLKRSVKEKAVTTSLWSFADKDRYARKKSRGRSFSYEFNRQSKELQDELDRVIAATLKKHLAD
jgi:ParB family chromosome partitioning protein